MTIHQPQAREWSLDKLLAAADIVIGSAAGCANVVVTGISDDSRKIQRGDLYIALSGSQQDGRAFIGSAIECGAVAVLLESDDSFSGDEISSAVASVPIIPVRNLRALAGPVSAAFFGHPSRSMTVVAVTGTNGKTTTSWLIAQALTQLGRRAAVLGTLGVGAPGALEPLLNTTPGAVELQRLLAGLRDAGFVAVAIEASSIGIAQQRLAGTQINTALFTNLTRDHLDYHGTMAAYAEAKAQLFSWPLLTAAVLNADDAYASQWLQSGRVLAAHVLTYGLPGRGHDIELTSVAIVPDGMSLALRVAGNALQVTTRLLGDFNAANLMAVAGALSALGYASADIEQVLGKLVAPVGRMEVFSHHGEPLCVVDYAHTPDALEKVLLVLRQRVGGVKNGALWCVFGCGGNRDSGKRLQMGEVAGRLADHVVVTSDNPRHEDPATIMAAIVAGTVGGSASVVSEPDRAKAIALAIGAAMPADVVLVAGKGHEAYQEIAGHRLPFSDQQTVQLALSARHGAMAGGAAC